MVTPTPAWNPTTDEVARIVAELRPVIDACVARARSLLAGAGAGDDVAVDDAATRRSA